MKIFNFFFLIIGPISTSFLTKGVKIYDNPFKKTDSSETPMKLIIGSGLTFSSVIFGIKSLGSPTTQQKDDASIPMKDNNNLIAIYDPKDIKLTNMDDPKDHHNIQPSEKNFFSLKEEYQFYLNEIKKILSQFQQQKIFELLTFDGENSYKINYVKDMKEEYLITILEPGNEVQRIVFTKNDMTMFVYDSSRQKPIENPNSFNHIKNEIMKLISLNHHKFNIKSGIFMIEDNEINKQFLPSINEKLKIIYSNLLSTLKTN
jgi:hypothetical protein